jgi:hypothetical protein
LTLPGTKRQTGPSPPKKSRLEKNIAFRPGALVHLRLAG